MIVGEISGYPPAASETPTHGTCSITIDRGTTLVLGAALPLAGFAPSTTGRAGKSYSHVEASGSYL